MTLTGRPTVVDRPEIIDREQQSDESEANGDTEAREVEVLGEGGGPVVNQLEFEPGDYEIVGAANTVAVLSTGEDEGKAFKQSFMNAAIQLKEIDGVSEGAIDIFRFGLENGIAEIGLSDQDIMVLRKEFEQEDSALANEEMETDEIQSDEDANSEEELEDGGDDEEDTKDSGNVEIEDVEEEIEEVKEDG